ncbi:uncharacterized protein LOC126682906 [Mercurialis annua]|uniref:uncharacterized protein LOC126682906 n=1 Tax=Mercurialis annua TaxID=3986 RepID=UPI00215E62C0|nr:uncharacterized protein LOC126682906 [Mercurialis annua]
MVKGGRVSIDNCLSTTIWISPWLQAKESGFVTTEMNVSLKGSKICQLLYKSSKQWNESIVRDIFNLIDANNMLAVPINLRDTSNSWSWILEKKRKFTVRSVYCSIRGEVVGENEIYGVFWNKLRNLHIPLDICSFLREGGSGFLPTAYSLAGKRVFINERCQVCNRMSESAGHLVRTNDGLNFRDWCRSWLYELKGEEAELVAIISWRHWINRNNIVWGKQGDNTVNTINTVSQHILAWKSARLRSSIHGELRVGKDEGNNFWRCPTASFVKTKVDVARFEAEGKIRVGCVLRDEHGVIIQAM